MKALLLGKKGIVVEDVSAQLDEPGLELFGGTGLDDVRSVFAAHPIDHVIIGAGIDLEIRLQIVRAIFELSDATTVHMKDYASGPQGMLPFVRDILSAMRHRNPRP